MQKTAYEMRISDWSSDVCSSDLGHAVGEAQRRLQGVGQPALQALPHHEAVDHHLDRVLLVAREVDLVGELVDLAVDASAGEALSSQVGEERVVGALTAADVRGEHLEAGTLGQLQAPVDDLLRRLAGDLRSALDRKSTRLNSSH